MTLTDDGCDDDDENGVDLNDYDDDDYDESGRLESGRRQMRLKREAECWRTGRVCELAGQSSRTTACAGGC